ncbi:MAG: hypothetical protein JSV79_01190 [Armatimonadota bacterium]|nr:MAG: hypothetical protein JSV79_01190 [Armatimonadota bacterium]
MKRVFAHVRVHGLGASVEAREHGGGRAGRGKGAGGKLLPNPRGASVEARSCSAKATQDRPVVLLDESGQRVVSVSLGARRYGVQPGASLWEAQRRCPEVLVAEADSEKYEYFWERVVEVCGDYTPRVREVTEEGGRGDGAKILRFAQNDDLAHALSLDLTGTERLFGPAKSIAQEIRNRLRVEVGVTASVGIGPNRMVARLACESARPATRPAGRPGEVVEVRPEEAAGFVGRLPLSVLPGVDEEWAGRLREMGIRRAKDLAALPEEAVRRALGEWGRRLWEIAQGGDPPEENEIGAAPARYWEKGVFSVQFDLRPPTEERERIRAALRAVTEEVGRRLRERGQAAGQVKLTLVFRDMRKVGARRTLRQPAGSAEALFQAAGALLERMKLNGRLVRRVRVTVSHLAVGPNGGQMGLPLLDQEARRERLAERVDQVKDRFGEGVVKRGSALELVGR